MQLGFLNLPDRLKKIPNDLIGVDVPADFADEAFGQILLSARPSVSAA